jgi:hypothetical protein
VRDTFRYKYFVVSAFGSLCVLIGSGVVVENLFEPITVFSVFYSAVGGEYRRQFGVRLRFRPAVGGGECIGRHAKTGRTPYRFFCLAIPWFLNADSLYIVYEFHRRTVCGYGRKIVVYGVIVVLLQLSVLLAQGRVFRGYGAGS